MSDLGPRAGTPSVGEDPEPSDDPTVPVSAEVMAAAQRAAVAHMEARMAAQAAAAGKPAAPAAPAKAAPQRGARPTAPEDRAVAAPRPPPQRLRGYREEDEKVIVEGAAVVEPSLSVDVDLDSADDDALTPHMPPAAYPPQAPQGYRAPPPGPAPTPYAPYAPGDAGFLPPTQPGAPYVQPGGLYAAPGAQVPPRRRRESVTVELPRGALGPPPPAAAQAPGLVSTRALLFVAIAISSLAVVLLAVLLLRPR
ncbi:MAG: hypothetical protein IPF92_30050 [Myxococcales bacterium]|jgi:hypothetical protein|nr:hypothetical protein [Myxococcales bacterium]MBL0196925.1 hypothetical protein [Myxococcales bacterium]